MTHKDHLKQESEQSKVESIVEHKQRQDKGSKSDTLCGKLRSEQSDSLTDTSIYRSDGDHKLENGTDRCNHGASDGTFEVKESTRFTSGALDDETTTGGNLSSQSTHDISVRVTSSGASGGDKFRSKHEKAKPPRFVFGHDCYPVTIESTGTETTIALHSDDGFDTDTAEKSALEDEMTKGTRRALTHLNFMGTIHLDVAAKCPVVSSLKVKDPCTPRDNVHRAYYSIDMFDKSSNTSDERKKIGKQNTASTPILILKTLPFGGGSVRTGVSKENTDPTKSQTIHQMTGHDKSNQSCYVRPPKNPEGTQEQTKCYCDTTVLKPKTASEKSKKDTKFSGTVLRYEFNGGHPTLPDGTEGIVKCTAQSRKEVGAATMGVGVIHFHGKDFKDRNTRTVLIPLKFVESETVTDTPRMSTKSVLAEKPSEKQIKVSVKIETTRHNNRAGPALDFAAPVFAVQSDRVTVLDVTRCVPELYQVH